MPALDRFLEGQVVGVVSRAVWFLVGRTEAGWMEMLGRRRALAVLGWKGIISGCSRAVFAVEIVVMRRVMVDGENVVYKFVPTLLSGSRLVCVWDFDRGFTLSRRFYEAIDR